MEVNLEKWQTFGVGQPFQQLLQQICQFGLFELWRDSLYQQWLAHADILRQSGSPSPNSKYQQLISAVDEIVIRDVTTDVIACYVVNRCLHASAPPPVPQALLPELGEKLSHWHVSMLNRRGRNRLALDLALGNEQLSPAAQVCMCLRTSDRFLSFKLFL